MPESADPVTREAARLLVIDPADRLLLMCWQHRMVRTPTGRVWIAPGGGLEPGESWEAAALRELREETGITDVPLGPCVWAREHTVEFDRITLRQVERYYVVRVAEIALSRDGWTAGEQRNISDMRWWTAGELATSKEYFAPRNLVTLLPAVLAGTYPPEPIDTGV